jgi:hypothetical protein
MKYQLGDLLDDQDAGLGYVSGIIEDIIQITWFGENLKKSYLSYHYLDVDRWIKNKNTIHYPVGKQ